jgi:hypothetical protein
MPIVVVVRLDGTPALEHLKDGFDRFTRGVDVS